MFKFHHKDSGHWPRHDETRMKEFVQAEAKKYNTTIEAIFHRIRRGKYPNLLRRKVNSNTVFVSFSGAKLAPKYL